MSIATSAPCATIVPDTSSPGIDGAPGGGAYPPLRCSTSGRFTPAATTRINTSSTRGIGTGRCTTRSTSGPPGTSGSIARIVVGIPSIGRAPCFALRALLTWRAAGSTILPMDLDEILPKRAGDPLAALIVQDLDPLSVKELEARIVALEAEVARTRAKIQCAVNHRASANDLFKS